MSVLGFPLPLQKSVITRRLTRLMSIRIIKSEKPLTDKAVIALRDRLREGGVVSGRPGAVGNVRDIVAGIIKGVKEGGDTFVVKHTNDFHKVALTPETLRVSQQDIQAARAAADPEFLELARRTIANIREYQQSIRVESPPVLRRGGRELSVRYTPIMRIGIYVPGGKAIYPSSLLMTAVPAMVAGVEEIVMVSPPTADGDIHSMLLGLADELGIDEIYRAAGVAGLAALACGTETIRPVAKICGPGNAFIAETKRQLFGRVGIDSIAGPSEVLIIADESGRADWVAGDMLAQVEHDPGSGVLVTTSAELADGVKGAIEQQLPALERADAARRCLDDYSLIIVVPDIDTACEVANDFAPEHLQIITADDDAVLAKIRNAGAIFLGAHTPVPLGDYYAGPSHVLPTGGGAKFFAPLSVNDFLKASSVVRYDAESLSADADDVIDFATREGLTGHARTVQMRTKTRSNPQD